MVSAAELTIDIDIDLHGSIAKLEGLATALRDVAAAQRLVDEDMNIDIDTSSLDGTTVAATPDGGVATDGGGSSIRRGAFNPDISRADINLGPGTQIMDGGNGAWRLRRAQMAAMSDVLTPDTEEISGLLEAFKNVDIRMEQMHNALAKIMPLLLVFIGALPAAIAGILALAGAAVTAAAAFAAIGGLGALGYGMSRQGDILENLQDVAEDIRDSFLDTFGPLAQRLAPMFEKGVGGLERFFSELAARGDTLLKFRDDAVAFGSFLIDYTATAIQRLGEFTQAAMPALEAIGQWISDTDFTNAFAQALRRAIIPLVIIADSIVRALPAMMKFSQGFLDVAAVISMTFGVLWELIDALGPFGELLGAITATILTLLTVTALYSAALWVLENQFISMALGAIPTSIAGLKSLAVQQYKSAAAAYTNASALGLVMSLLTAGLGVYIALEAFEALNEKINETTGNLREFGSVSGKLDGAGLGVAGESASGQTVVNQNTYNFDGDGQSNRRGIAKAEYTDRYFSGGI